SQRRGPIFGSALPSPWINHQSAPQSGAPTSSPTSSIPQRSVRKMNQHGSWMPGTQYNISYNDISVSRKCEYAITPVPMKKGRNPEAPPVLGNGNTTKHSLELRAEFPAAEFNLLSHAVPNREPRKRPATKGMKAHERNPLTVALRGPLWLI